MIEKIRRKLSRIFLGRIIIREIGTMCRDVPVKISTHFRRVMVQPMRTEPRVNSALFVKWKSSRAKSAGSIMSFVASSESFKVSRIKPGLSKNLGGTRRHKLNIKRRAAAKHAMWRINKVPYQRHNRINFLKNPLKMERATILAFYSPVYQERVLKSALDKSSGNLLFWYDNKRVKMGEKYHLLLLRVFGGEKPLKWVWLPADKKIS